MEEFAPYMGLKRNKLPKLEDIIEFAPYMGLKRVNLSFI